MSKRKLIISAIITILLAMPVVAVSPAITPQVKLAISKYKGGDYLGCIQDMEEYTAEDPTNAVAYYYMGIAYMKIGLKDNAIESLQKVSTINSIPKLSSYAIQATRCMQKNITPCTYKNYSDNQLENLIKDPRSFFDTYAGDGNGGDISEDIEDDMDRLFNGSYPSNIHPDANKVIQETRLIQEQERVNTELKQKLAKPQKKSQKNTNNKIASANPSDKEIADAVRILSKAGYKFSAPVEQTKQNQEQQNQVQQNSRMQYQNMAQQYALDDDMEQMAMLFGNNNRSRQNDDWAMLNFMMNQKNADGTPAKMNPELVKTMMMTQMIDGYDFMNDNNNKDK